MALLKKSGSVQEKNLSISSNGNTFIQGTLKLPAHADTLVIFSPGIGSNRLSPENNIIASELLNSGYATFLYDLNTEKKSLENNLRLHTELLTSRLKIITRWFTNHMEFTHLNLAYFGTSTGSASAIKASIDLRGAVKAIISRGGRPDLVDENLLPLVKCPILFIVGEFDFKVIKLTKIAYGKLTCEKQIAIVPGASHLFEEEGKLEEVTKHAIHWLQKYVPVQQQSLI